MCVHSKYEKQVRFELEKVKDLGFVLSTKKRKELGNNSSGSHQWVVYSQTRGANYTQEVVNVVLQACSE